MNSIDNLKELRKTFQKRNFYTIKDSGIVYIYALVLPLAIGLIFAYLSMFIVTKQGVEFEEGKNIITQLFNGYLWFAIPYALLSEVVFFCLFFGYNKFNRITITAANLSFKKVNFWSALLSIAVGIICVLGFIWLIEGCFGNTFDIWGLVKDPEESLQLDNSNLVWLFANLIILGVVPAICEELLFRGVVLQGLREKFSGMTSALLCALLFALMHQSVTQFIYPFILGFVLSIVMERTGNLFYCILIHMFNNFITIILSFLNNIRAIKLSFNVSWWGWICAILIAAATCALLWVIHKFYLSRHKNVAVEKEGEVKQVPPTVVGKLPMTIICGMILAVILIVINAIS